MMRENHLQWLPVIDVYKRIVGMITMRDFAEFEEQRRKQRAFLSSHQALNSD
jgi:CBS-domain-containing membrane protein